MELLLFQLKIDAEAQHPEWKSSPGSERWLSLHGSYLRHRLYFLHGSVDGGWITTRHRFYKNQPSHRSTYSPDSLLDFHNLSLYGYWNLCQSIQHPTSNRTKGHYEPYTRTYPDKNR